MKAAGMQTSAVNDERGESWNAADESRTDTAPKSLSQTKKKKEEKRWWGEGRGGEGDVGVGVGVGLR